MSRQFRFIFYVFFGVVLFFSIPNIQTAFAQNSASSNCVLTKVGNPDPNQPLPPGCEEGGGAQGVVALAKAHLDGTYVWGAPSGRPNWASMDPNAGKAPTTFDCSGFAYWAWYWGSGGKVNLPGNTDSVWNGNGPWTKTVSTNGVVVDYSKLQPGDLVYFGTESSTHHVGIYEGAGACGTAHCFLEYYTSGKPGRENKLEAESDYVGFVRPNAN